MSEQASQDWCPPRSDSASTPAPDGSGQLTGGDQPADALCHIGWQPILITGLLRDVLTRHFASADNIENKDLARAIWQEGEASGILIESVHRWRSDNAMKRPAVLLKRNAYQNMRVSLDDLSNVTPEGFREHTTLWVGSHTVFCLHGTGAACEILATEVQRELTQFAPVLRERLELHKLQVLEVGSIGIVEEADQNYVVPITIGWAYEESWRLTPAALHTTAIHVDLLTES